MIEREKWEHNDKVSIIGGQVHIDICKKIFNDELLPQITPEIGESEIRPLIAALIDKHNIDADILYGGNSIWSNKKIIFSIRKIKKMGMMAMSPYLYEFLHLCCGSIAHYDRFGWINTYPEIADLKNFFRRNEFGEAVYSHIPGWKTDVKDIVLNILRELKIK